MNRQNEGDATIEIGGSIIAVHSSVLGAESPFLADIFRKSFQRTGKRVYKIQSADIHSVWRLLELAYIGEYSSVPCPVTHIRGMHITKT